jgi:hypothetical protein
MRFSQSSSPLRASSACTVFCVLDRKITPSCTIGVTSTAPPSFIAQAHLSCSVRTLRVLISFSGL